MTKDYAKNKHAQFQTQTHSKNIRSRLQGESVSFLPSWAWLTIGMTIGFFLFGLLYWKVLLPKEQTVPEPTPVQQQVTTEETNTTVGAKETEPTPTTEPTRFDFYTILPNMSVEHTEEAAIDPQPTRTIPARELPPQNAAPVQARRTPPPQPSHTPQTQAATLHEKYIIQVASFRSHAQAESLKASLALKGFESNIQPITMSNQQVWYRVYLGPFVDRGDAKTVQSKLESKQKLNSFVLKINV